MKAIVAGSAVVLRIILTEIIEQQLPPALVGFGVSHGFQQELFPYLLLGHRLALHEFLEFLDILVTVKGDAVATSSVSSCPSGLLIIAFYAFRNIIMYHEPHVRLVDTHSESDCGHDYVYFLHQEPVLIFRTGLGIQSGVVRQGLDTVYIEELRQFRDLFPAEAIHYSGFAGMLLDILDDVPLRIYLVPDFIVKIRPVER